MDKLTIGRNMREIRHARGLSLPQVADQMTALTGDEYHLNALSKWERGLTCPSLVQASFLSKVLGCSLEALTQEDYPQAEHRLYQEIQSQSVKERAILLHAATKWVGDVHALIEFVSLYMALPKERRAEISNVGISEYEQAQKAGELVPEAIPVDIDYLNKKWRHLVGVR